MNSSAINAAYAPGLRVLIRDAEWVVRRVDLSSDGGHQLTCDGVSELVRDRTGIFLSKLDEIEVLDPAATELVQDLSGGYRDSLLYFESLLRRTAPNDDRIHVADRAAMDLVPFQLDPAKQALRQPRQRILIADAVGLGKTLEAGILVSELIQRGRGKRILVLTLKSMLTQFQKEFWNRFTIPLTRLDSIGLQRVRNRIPTNHNPFYYYDKAIISIDTLKQDSEYRVYLEQAYWDIIIIDEVHNVAERGNGGRSLRAKLAKLLASRSDTLIMLSATPHDGKARSFASLMNMLDPTAISDPDNYVAEDFRNKGLVIRRFKKDIQGQVAGEFRDRRIFNHNHQASPEEEAAYEALLQVRFTRQGVFEADKPAQLLRVTLQKALFSSPAACCASIDNRMAELAKNGDSCSEDIQNEIADLRTLHEAATAIQPDRYAKYQTLLKLLSDKMRWSSRHTDDRLVIFSERIDTLDFLEKNLIRDLGLKERQVAQLHGRLSDLEQQQRVEQFGQESSPLRLLLCSDVASEGINLHYLCHRLIHFDMPWSLMVFQQRNGRVDRYGQEKTPEIHYLVTESRHETILGDLRILEVLRNKDEQAYRNIGDPSAFMGVYDQQKEEALTRHAMAHGLKAEKFDRKYQPKQTEGDDLLALFLGSKDQAEVAAESMPDETAGEQVLSLFDDDFSFCQASLQRLKQQGHLGQFSANRDAGVISLMAPDDLRYRFSLLPREIRPENWEFVLSADKEAIQKEVKRCRQDEEAWPKIHFLWPQHPVMDWLQDRVLVTFGRHKAPVLALPSGLDLQEAVFIVAGQVPNRKGHPLIHEWLGLSFQGASFVKIEPFARTIERTGLGRQPIPNRGQERDLTTLQQLLPEAVKQARRWVIAQRDAFDAALQGKLAEQLAELERLHGGQHRQLELALEKSAQAEGRKAALRRQRGEEIDDIFKRHREWVQDTLTTERQPYLHVVGVLVSA